MDTYVKLGTIIVCHVNKDLKCYVFFDGLLVFNYDEEYSFTRVDETGIDSVSQYTNERFVPVAERLSSDIRIDPIVRDKCTQFLQNYYQ